MHSYNNVARLRHFHGAAGYDKPRFTDCTLRNLWTTPCLRREPLPARTVNLNIEIADLLPQGVAVKPKEIGGPDLVASGGGQRRRQ
jgi:hypothetical protein